MLFMYIREKNAHRLRKAGKKVAVTTTAGLAKTTIQRQPQFTYGQLLIYATKGNNLYREQ